MVRRKSGVRFSPLAHFGKDWEVVGFTTAIGRAYKQSVRVPRPCYNFHTGMREYLSEAVVLHREPHGELDFSVAFFTKRHGKIIAKAKSARKVTSKLSGHLLPGYIADVRIVEQRGLHVADALSLCTLPIARFDLYFLSTILPEWERDAALWDMLVGGAFAWPAALSLLGWADEKNYCMQCRVADADVFYGKTQELFCANCASPGLRGRPEDYVQLYGARNRLEDSAVVR